MKPILKDGKLVVTLHKVERTQLLSVIHIGRMLVALHQDEGATLIEAADAVLKKCEDTSK